MVLSKHVNLQIVNEVKDIFAMGNTIKVEYRKPTENSKYSDRDKTVVVVNDIVDERSYCSNNHHGKFCHVVDTKIIGLILNCSFEHLREHFEVLFLDRTVDWWIDGLECGLMLENNEGHSKCIIRQQMYLNLEGWSRAWSISEFQAEFKLNVDLLSSDIVRYYCSEGEETILNGFGLEYLVQKPSMLVADVVKDMDDQFSEILKATIKKLLSQINKDSIVTYFHFPDHIKAACCQYLIYFTQFIADLGLDVNSELKENSDHVFFRVIPKDKNEALQQVHEALSIYLSVIEQKDFHIQVNACDDIAARQWEANVYHLKAQLNLARAIMEAKDATIESLKLTNYQYKQLLQTREDSGERREELIEGVVTIKEYDGNGFSINFAEILKRLKRLKK